MSIESNLQPMPMSVLIQEQSCCGSHCTYCPYVDQYGSRSVRGSITINKKMILRHVTHLIKENQLEEVAILKRLIKNQILSST